MQKWEDCMVGGVTSSGSQSPDTLAAQITFFTARGCTTTKLSKGADTLAQVIAKLGAEGWEMVGAGNTNVYYHALYFKRPAP